MMKKWFAAGTMALVASASLLPAQAQTVTPITAAKLKKAIAAQKGKAVVVNFWATWCPPCVGEMPSLSKLRANYAKRGLALILVSADDPRTAGSKVKPFLKKNKLPGSYIIGGDQSRFIGDFDAKVGSSFGLPRTYIYNKSGKLARAFSGDKSYKEWEAVVKPFLR